MVVVSDMDTTNIFLVGISTPVSEYRQTTRTEFLCWVLSTTEYTIVVDSRMLQITSAHHILQHYYLQNLHRNPKYHFDL